MPTRSYIGINGIARNIKNSYIGIGGVAHKVKKAYIGIDGVAKKIFPTDIVGIEFHVNRLVYFSTTFEEGAPITYHAVCRAQNPYYPGEGNITPISYQDFNSLNVGGINFGSNYYEVYSNQGYYSYNPPRWIGIACSVVAVYDNGLKDVIAGRFNGNEVAAQLDKSVTFNITATLSPRIGNYWNHEGYILDRWSVSWDDRYEMHNITVKSGDTSLDTYANISAASERHTINSVTIDGKSIPVTIVNDLY